MISPFSGVLEQSCFGAELQCHSQRVCNAKSKMYFQLDKEEEGEPAWEPRLLFVCGTRRTSAAQVFLLPLEASSSALQDPFSVAYACRFDVQGLRFPGDEAD